MRIVNLFALLHVKGILMADFKKDLIKKIQRKLRVRASVKHTGLRPRVNVHRSLNQIYAQIIDDSTHRTLVSCSTLQLSDVKGDKKAQALAVGKELAKRAKDQNIQLVVFDRGAYKYHGRVAALAQGLREGGLQF